MKTIQVILSTIALFIVMYCMAMVISHITNIKIVFMLSVFSLAIVAYLLSDEVIKKWNCNN